MAELFYQTVHSVNAADYTREQEVVRQGVALTNYVMEKPAQTAGIEAKE